MAAILLRNLNKTYSGKRGVTDINLRVERGEIFLLSGLNDNLNWLANISLFNLFDVYAISQGGGLPVGAVMWALVLFTAGSVAGWMKLIHRDL
jgi:ABC-type arginine transport system ATPase subunit